MRACYRSDLRIDLYGEMNCRVLAVVLGAYGGVDEGILDLMFLDLICLTG